ncbi:M10 family metallopeptidase C-terminal domain-containing protein [Frigidibacter sp. RF13]|uniref:M10 family metallopeptidase C-terminal domain-containing protein n=1 Tax=Frigidibacter sp. RF13 TaxID=2997340 RepID=UPI002271FC3F|nr:M10 family metallopeptidase C-terminal domain-containing protein [Frigidibacter sp. RF13]MCY1125298.1 M10 family metallopeptidase C-terminal domain-containing protein [Frigidibacter sp. RF13]
MGGIGHPIKVVSLTGDSKIDGLLSGYAWADQVITYSMPTTNVYGYSGEPDTFEPISWFQTVTVIGDALGLDWSTNAPTFAISGFTGLSFLGAQDSHLRFGYSNAFDTAWAYGPGNLAQSGDIWFTRDVSFPAPELGTWHWMATLREIGHALGLSCSDPLSSSQPALPYDYDAMEYTIMSARSFVGDTTPGFENEYYGFAQTYMMLDIAALQQMYGADYTTNSGNTTYVWAPGGGDTWVNGWLLLQPHSDNVFATVWDGGGIDTYDLSAYSNSIQISLKPGASSLFSWTQRAYLGSGQYATGNIYNALLFQGNQQSLIENAIGGSGNDMIDGNGVGNYLVGGAGGDTLSGFFGDDTLEGGAGADALYGGADRDTASYAQSSGSVTASLIYAAVNAGEAAGDSYSSIEDLIGSVYADELYGDGNANILRGNVGWDLIFGYGGDDTIMGGKGYDTLVGGGGADEMDGGLGFDTASYATASVGVDADLSVGAGSSGEANGDRYISIEALIGSLHGDTLTGDGGDNGLYANWGDDLVSGMNGNDTIQGGRGSDTLSGGIGNDTLRGGLDADTLTGGSGFDAFVFKDALDVDDIDLITDFNVGEDVIHLGHLVMSAVQAVSGPLGGGLGLLDSAYFHASSTGQATTATEVILYNTTTGALTYDADGSGGNMGIQFATLTAGLSLTASDFIVV